MTSPPRHRAMRSSLGTEAHALTLALPVATSTIDSCTGTTPSASMAVTRSAVLASYGSRALQSCSTMGVSPEGD
eukprot:scaffold139804_cov130-Phaeocystis_antarctica.AAC.1